MAKNHRRVIKGKLLLLLYLDDIDVNRIHVREPYDVVFLCGGPYNYENQEQTISLRDAFLKSFPNVMNHGHWIIAEDITRQHDFFENYIDILTFETDLAQIVKLIVLFCESIGSAAELGAFAAINEILVRLFVVVREEHWEKTSFIKLGPLRRIEKQLGRQAIHVIEDSQIGINGDDLSGINRTELIDLIQQPITQRVSSKQESTTLDKTKAGHRIKLIVGLLQEYGALTFEEILEALSKLDVTINDNDLKGYLCCAEAVEWVNKKSRGSHDYYLPTTKNSPQDAAIFHMKAEAQVKDKIRRRTDIREYWKDNDKPRFSIISNIE